MTEASDYTSLIAHAHDLQEKSERWHRSLATAFLNEEEQAAVLKNIAVNSLVKLDGGYPDAQKKKVIFLSDEEDDFSDIVCLCAETDQRFRKIGHRDILGALMHLQIDRHSFGDFWVEDSRIYLYTSPSMAGFLIDHLIRIGQLSVSFYEIEERPSQVFRTEKITCVIASERLDAIVAGVVRCSRSEAKEMIRRGLVQVNHVTLEEPDELCNNNVTISIRGTGRFQYLGAVRTTRNGRLAAEFLHYI